MKRKTKLIAVIVVIAVFSVSLISFCELTSWRSNPNSPTEDYTCHISYDGSKYWMCRLFTEQGTAIIQEENGMVIEDLILSGAPIGSYALWAYPTDSGIVVVTFPNGTVQTCNLLHAPHGPCSEGIA
jgi:hypothetical protein